MNCQIDSEKKKNYFQRKIGKLFQNVVCWIFYPAYRALMEGGDWGSSYESWSVILMQIQMTRVCVVRVRIL